MQTVGAVILMTGIAVMLLAHLYVAVMIFTGNPIKGILCFLIPGYVFLIAKREGFYLQFLATFAIGIVGMVVGGLILS